MRFTSCPVQHVLIRNLVAESQGVCGAMLGMCELMKDQALFLNMTASNCKTHRLPYYF